ncbi:MAG: Phosphate transport system substrate-binding protein [Lacunisphaera sp.]|nr:Phosphate transport system substrate-binding protein [Lacunisphaera sp.]
MKFSFLHSTGRIAALFLFTAALNGFAADPASDDRLPVYAAPAGVNKGVLRVFGAGLKGLLKDWEAGYMKRNPDVRIADNPGGSDAAIGVLQHGTAEIAVFGRELELNDYLGFFENKGYNPTEIIIASGTYETPGGSWAPVIFVNKDNPLAQLTMKQLDGIFGSERTGAYEGYVWKTENARSAKDNIRTWGQLGLTGEWANREIQTYGYAAGGMAHFFEIEVLKGSNKWNGNYRQYVENGTKILTAGREGGGVLAMLAELEHDKYGIAWAGMPQWNQVPQITGIKVIALGRDGGPFVLPGKETLLSRAYPLTRSIYICLDKEPGRPLSPKVKDFVKYVLSEEGQALVRQNGIYFPLPAAVVREQLKKLE